MRTRFAPLLLAPLLLVGPGLALAAAPETVAQAANPAPANPAPGGEAPQAPGGQQPGAAAVAPPAPVPDPFLAEMLKTCRDAASGDPGVLQRMTDAGWGPVVDGATQTPFYQSFTGEKDYDGVGTVDITWSLEVYPSMTEGYCSISVETALRKIGIADMKTMSDLTGQLRESDEGIASTWEDKGPNPTTFVQVDQHNADLYFILDVTRLMQKPAADIPYVQPPPASDDNQDTEEPDMAPDTTNADN